MAPLGVKPFAERDEPLRFEKLLAEISTFFINLPADRIGAEIEVAQHRVCEFLDLDRSTLFQSDGGDPETLLLTHIYQPAGSRPPPERMSLKEFFPWTLQKILGGFDPGMGRGRGFGRGYRCWKKAYVHDAGSAKLPRSDTAQFTIERRYR